MNIYIFVYTFGFELTDCQVVGPENVISFWKSCFGSQQYHVTSLGDGVHEQLWRYRDEKDSS